MHLKLRGKIRYIAQATASRCRLCVRAISEHTRTSIPVVCCAAAVETRKPVYRCLRLWALVGACAAWSRSRDSGLGRPRCRNWSIGRLALEFGRALVSVRFCCGPWQRLGFRRFWNQIPKLASAGVGPGAARSSSAWAFVPEDWCKSFGE